MRKNTINTNPTTYTFRVFTVHVRAEYNGFSVYVRAKTFVNENAHARLNH